MINSKLKNKYDCSIFKDLNIKNKIFQKEIYTKNTKNNYFKINKNNHQQLIFNNHSRFKINNNSSPNNKNQLNNQNPANFYEPKIKKSLSEKLIVPKVRRKFLPKLVYPSKFKQINYPKKFHPLFYQSEISRFKNKINLNGLNKIKSNKIFKNNEFLNGSKINMNLSKTVNFNNLCLSSIFRNFVF